MNKIFHKIILVILLNVFAFSVFGFTNQSEAATQNYIFIGDSRIEGMIGGASSIKEYNQGKYYNGKEIGGVATGKFESNGKILKSYGIGSGNFTMFHDNNPKFWKKIEKYISTANKKYKGTKVLLNLGVNGLNAFNSPNNYVEAVKTMAKNNKNIEFYFISVFHCAGTNSYLNSGIDIYNNTIKKYVENAKLDNLFYKDINTTEVNKAIENAGGDGLHPFDAYSVISDAMYNAVNEKNKDKKEEKSETHTVDLSLLKANYNFYPDTYLTVKEGTNKLTHVKTSTDKPESLKNKKTIKFYTDKKYILKTTNGKERIMYKAEMDGKIGFVNSKLLNTKYFVK